MCVCVWCRRHFNDVANFECLHTQMPASSPVHRHTAHSSLYYLNKELFFFFTFMPRSSHFTQYTRTVCRLFQCFTAVTRCHNIHGCRLAFLRSCVPVPHNSTKKRTPLKIWHTLHWRCSVPTRLFIIIIYSSHTPHFFLHSTHSSLSLTRVFLSNANV